MSIAKEFRSIMTDEYSDYILVPQALNSLWWNLREASAQPFFYDAFS